MTATELLALRRPEDLFPGDVTAAKARYRQLSHQWHPDRPGGSAEVFAHLSTLYREALDRLADGRWEGAARLLLQTLTGFALPLDVRASAPFALGQSLVSDKQVTYLIDPIHRTLFDQGHKAIAKFPYANAAMRQEFERYLPYVTAPPVTLEDQRLLLQVAKTPDLIRLRDLVTHTGLLDAKHVAWIVSGLMNLCCYLTYAKIVHHDISPDTYFVSPLHHSGALLGGWWHARARGAPVGQIPKRTHDLLPFKVRVTRRASTLTDLELVRATARECLAPGAPTVMLHWLTTPGTESAFNQYAEWKHVVEMSFGPRRFTMLPVDADAVYGALAGRST